MMPTGIKSKEVGMRTADVLNTPQLRAANEAAMGRGLNRWVSGDLIDRLDPYGIHVVTMRLLHDDRWGSAPDEAEWRCILQMKMVDNTLDDPPVEATLDIALEDWDKFTATWGEYGPEDWRPIPRDARHGGRNEPG
jgi:hypothetical protein